MTVLDSKTWVSHLVSLPANFMQLLIRIYQLTISKFLGPRCKYYPSCSHYGIQAYKIHGFFKGTTLTIWRILRCNPLSDGGVDYVPVKGSWKNPWTEPGSVTEQTYTLNSETKLANKKEHQVETSNQTIRTKGKVSQCC